MIISVINELMNIIIAFIYAKLQHFDLFLYTLKGRSK